MKKDIHLNPILITINIGKAQFRVGVKLYSTKEDFEKAIMGRGGSTAIKELRKDISYYVSKAEQILERLIVPSKDSFLRLFKLEMNLPISLANKTSVAFVFQEKIAELNAEDRISTAYNCKLALTSFLKYKKELYFEDIDLKFLKGYAAWVEKSGNTTTTAQIYLRNLKAIFNRAIKAGYIPERLYPFSNYVIGASAKSKGVLYPHQIKALWEYEPQGIREKRAKAFFFFCYLCNGMNFKDVAYLKYRDLKDDCFTFVREKTKRTSNTEKQITVYLHPEAKRIIEEWGNKSTDLNDYVFSLLNGYKTIASKEIARGRHRRVINKKLSAIGKKLGFDVHVCLNLARHSFATRLKIDGTPTSFISDAMGHSNSQSDYTRTCNKHS